MESGDRILVAAGLTAAVVVGAFVLWGPGGAPRGRKRRGQIAGLHNLGRTCFLNTLLQAMAACPQFTSWLKKYTTSSVNNSMITTLSTVIEVVNGSHEGARCAGPVCPLGVLRCLGALGWVVPEDQHDAHELLHVLLSCVDEETQATAKRRPGCLSDALGLLTGGTPNPIFGSNWGNSEGLSALPVPGPALALRSVSSPATPDSPLVKCARSLSQATIPLPNRNNKTNIESNGPSSLGEFSSKSLLARGVSRSFCQLDRLGRPAPPPPPAPQPPFNGSTATRLQCTICSHKSPIRYDKFDSISLHLGSTVGPLSVVSLLRAFTAPELVRGVACDRCNQGREPSLSPILTTHIKSLSIGKLPLCLCLHIGRTQWSASGLTKRGDHVSIQETLCLAPFTSTLPPKVDLTIPLAPGMSQSVPSAGLTWLEGLGGTGDKPNDEWRALYRLQAVVVHVGGPRSGHFVTYRRGNAFEAKRWFYTSDTVVHEVTLDEVLHSSAYMLFYEKYNLMNQKMAFRTTHA